MAWLYIRKSTGIVHLGGDGHDRVALARLDCRVPSCGCFADTWWPSTLSELPCGLWAVDHRLKEVAVRAFVASATGGNPAEVTLGGWHSRVWTLLGALGVDVIDVRP